VKRILIARSAGFCFGVKRAISIADETARLNEGTPVLDMLQHDRAGRVNQQERILVWLSRVGGVEDGEGNSQIDAILFGNILSAGR